MKKHQHYGELVAVAHFCAIQPEVACVVLIQVEPLPPSQLETVQPGCKKRNRGDRVVAFFFCRKRLYYRHDHISL